MLRRNNFTFLELYLTYVEPRISKANNKLLIGFDINFDSDNYLFKSNIAMYNLLYTWLQFLYLDRQLQQQT